MNLDDRLTAWGAAERLAAGDPPPLEVPAVRRRWAPLAAAAAAVLVAGGAVLLVGHSKVPAPDRPTAPQQRVVPWAPLASQGLQPSPLPGQTADPSVRACTAEDLRASHAGDGEGAGGNWIDSFVLTNVAQTSCRLEGEAEGLDTVLEPDTVASQGHPHTFWPARLSDVFPVAPTVLTPGDSGQVSFNFYVRCDDGSAGRTYGSLKLRALGGTIPVPGSLYLGCAKPADGIGFSQLGDPAPEASYAPDPVADLVPTIQLPATVKAGETLRYTVTLTNPTAADIPLDLCPDFLQTMPGFKNTYLLNCAQADPVPAGGAEVFAMELPVPADVSGPAKVTWFLNRGVDRTASGTVEVTGGTATAQPTEQSSQPSEQGATCTTDRTTPPCATGLQQGQTFPYTLETHCGIRALYADGREWRPVAGQVLDDGSHNPPTGTGNPFDSGMLRVDGADRLTWTPASNQSSYAFRSRTADDGDLPLCD